MVWQNEIDELNRRLEMAGKMGGEPGVSRQHDNGKMTVRERIKAFADPGTFNELSALAGSSRYENNELVNFVSYPRVIGTSKINGMRVLLDGGDFTVRGGAGERGHGAKPNVLKYAVQWRLPLIRLLDAVGGSVRTFEQLGRTYLPDGPGTTLAVELLNQVPVVSAVLGSVAGLPAIEACLCHFNVMVKDTSQVFAGGPPVVKAAFGYDITKEDLGDYRSQVIKGGVIDNLADSEEEAFEMIRKFLSFMPSSVWKKAPRVETDDDPERRDEELLSVIPRDPRKRYDPYKILDHVLDRDSFFEIAPHYGKARITGLARANGYPIGVMINNPNHLGGTTDAAAGSKAMRLWSLCDTFHLPVVSFVDEPGFMVGKEAQDAGIVRAGARMVIAQCRSQSPWVSFYMKQAYGVAGQTHYRPTGMYHRYAWPSGKWGSMHIEGGVSAAYRRDIAASDDPEAKRLEIEAMLNAMASPFRTAEATGGDGAHGLDIIDPRDTRRMLCDFVDMAQDMLDTQLGPPMSPYLP
ncbi:MAG: carboxyl transferase domain-containing protein [SAR202 cluster bacterium]|jgi:acetyl-CoA carboxylase carboxyltransferase component|nr:carboxyl transferase domain-containing protein [SAR202 cluster bacterium]MDP6301788.1 carboxyl transferase domain-containing protein [SAR202 cluster bacterium]MDP7104038.1 carboxyl transferase domain-containing protein [SAR202 cluster bacterium]MDP7225649.1 carboxyl transferase domain-containing protein [SAR202 cluster bacterium]MDP7412985.1 carboxyl transferase domain-containing protein [SAR202 cluster bacterium]|tara:strand:- start:3916 stop:5478 length:1563 start_codon:yes stop_codon:yes gene_type:complete